MDIKVKIVKSDGTVEYESLTNYCARLSKRNNANLYLIEDYLGKKMLSDQKLSEIRDSILTVSADISKLCNGLVVESGENDEELS